MKHETSSAKDFFLHLLSSVTLYMSAIAFLMIAFQLIGYLFPDISIDSWRGDYSSEALRAGISMLLITLPVFFGTRAFLAKMYAKDAARKEFKLRKWLIYLTLFVASLIIIISLIFTVNEFLSGELTTRFILKALVTILVALSMLSYYFIAIKDELTKNKRMMYLWGVSIVSILLVVSTFVVIGSPQQARFARFDNERISDLNELVYEINNFYATEDELPTALNDLPLLLHYSRDEMTIDPVTREEYVYEIVDEDSYKLCVIFDTDTKDPEKPRDGADGWHSDEWNHPMGEHCFERDVEDTEFAKEVIR
jgi:hypothetical protein